MLQEQHAHVVNTSNVPIQEIEKQVVRASMAAVAVCARKGWDDQDVEVFKSATRLLTGLLDV
jgi:hypothetical protein